MTCIGIETISKTFVYISLYKFECFTFWVVHAIFNPSICERYSWAKQRQCHHCSEFTEKKFRFGDNFFIRHPTLKSIPPRRFFTVTAHRFLQFIKAFMSINLSKKTIEPKSIHKYQQTLWRLHVSNTKASISWLLPWL